MVQSASADDLAMLSNAPVRAMLKGVSQAVRVSDDGAVEVVSEDALRGGGIERLVHAAVFGEDEDVRDTARWTIAQVGRRLGVAPASIHELYMARGRGEAGGFTVPAINVRAMTFDTGRALFAAARELKVGALILEIARSEIGYTDQRPAEYVAVLTAAALKEGWTGPLFVQGDHFQVNAKKYKAAPDAELRAVKDIIREGLHAGFYNIDVDTSTLVDLDKEGLDAQQELNYRLSAELTAYIRRHEPQGITVSVGGEIGEVGTENSTPEELRAYMDGYNRELQRLGQGGAVAGLAKISVQSGTTHGGTVLPDGTIADVAIDFETLRVLSQIARDEYGMSGAVQHGASTLPQSAFGNFPTVETAEIHLATNFQNIVYDHPQFPGELRERMYEHCRTSFPEERKPTDTEQQFIYKARKKALGAFKRELWALPEENRAAIRQTLREQFDFLFRQLKVDGTQETVQRIVPLPELRPGGPGSLRMKAAEDDWDLSD
jgi:hypothetical protein